jgi:hypothetical protein
VIARKPLYLASRGATLQRSASASLPDRRATTFRVSHKGEGIDDTDSIEGAREIVRGQQPGRYHVDEIRAEPLPSGHTRRQWGRLIRRPDGRVEDEPEPWPDRS